MVFYLFNADYSYECQECNNKYTGLCKNGETSVYGGRVIILTVLLYIVYYIFEKKNEALSRKIEGGVLVASVFLYACVSVLQNNDIYFVVAMSALTVMAVIYCIRYAGIVHINMSKKSYIIIMAVSGGLYILFVSFCMVTRYLSYGSLTLIWDCSHRCFII